MPQPSETAINLAITVLMGACFLAAAHNLRRYTSWWWDCFWPVLSGAMLALALAVHWLYPNPYIRTAIVFPVMLLWLVRLLVIWPIQLRRFRRTAFFVYCNTHRLPVGHHSLNNALLAATDHLRRTCPTGVVPTTIHTIQWHNATPEGSAYRLWAASAGDQWLNHHIQSRPVGTLAGADSRPSDSSAGSRPPTASPAILPPRISRKFDG